MLSRDWILTVFRAIFPFHTQYPNRKACMSKVAVLQSSYVPWKGYFDLLHEAELFVFYDDVQYTKNDWRNRNQIKTTEGRLWLTVPVGAHLQQRICDTVIRDRLWPVKHWKTIQQYYSRATYFERYRDFLAHVYLEREWNNLSALNQYLIITIARDFLGISTRFADSRDYPLSGHKGQRLLSLLEQLGTDLYISGPSAHSYIDEADFAAHGVRVVYKDYTGYPEYRQFYPPFEHHVSILDLLVHTGSEAPYYIWGWREE